MMSVRKLTNVSFIFLPKSTARRLYIQKIKKFKATTSPKVDSPKVEANGKIEIKNEYIKQLKITMEKAKDNIFFLLNTSGGDVRKDITKEYEDEFFEEFLEYADKRKGKKQVVSPIFNMMLKKVKSVEELNKHAKKESEAEAKSRLNRKTWLQDWNGASYKELYKLCLKYKGHKSSDIRRKGMKKKAEELIERLLAIKTLYHALDIKKGRSGKPPQMKITDALTKFPDTALKALHFLLDLNHATENYIFFEDVEKMNKAGDDEYLLQFEEVYTKQLSSCSLNISSGVKKELKRLFELGSKQGWIKEKKKKKSNNNNNGNTKKKKNNSKSNKKK